MVNCKIHSSEKTSFAERIAFKHLIIEIVIKHKYIRLLYVRWQQIIILLYERYWYIIYKFSVKQIVGKDIIYVR